MYLALSHALKCVDIIALLLLCATKHGSMEITTLFSLTKHKISFSL